MIKEFRAMKDLKQTTDIAKVYPKPGYVSSFSCSLPSESKKAKKAKKAKK